MTNLNIRLAASLLVGLVLVPLAMAQDTRSHGRAAASAEGGVTARREVAYGEHKAQRLDVYAPRKAKDAPVMVYIHGGGWRKGDKSRVGRKVEFFTERGWVFVSANYRLLPLGKHPRNVEDVAAALAWVHDHIAEFGGDPKAIFLMGHSAGAHLVSLVATDARPLRKVGKSLAILKGVISLDTQAYDIPRQMAQRSSVIYRNAFSEDVETQRDASPIYHVARDKGIPPFLICYSRGMGWRPNPNRRAQAVAFAKALQAAGVAAEVVDASDRNHGEINAWFGKPGDKVTGKAKAFLEALLGAEAVKDP